ncbi:major facilitator superfamily domain-containing protein [Pisolithus orientalis]|uniref:major facilitator superfamily domain-containing protein n=1 Tax=Pisolithus orientalis TaxID=936130 RepID=UPI002224280F|nr:major facilitator superfamily domain-containing protein [Pisolithus orientalis]KAI6010769.1 major facilitator superfamily domain-containing protein [Pisolithus orientalis]
MHPQEVDEETPLIPTPNGVQDGSPKAARTPLPWRQFSILLLLQLSEPLTSQVIAPFLPQLIRDIGITHGDDSSLGYYVGLVHSLFFMTEACTIFHWSRASDMIGRKPVLMTGLLGLAVSMYCFGLSKTFLGLLFSRCLSGALNGNIGVMKSMIVEITDSTNLALACGFTPLAWFVGTTIGPLIGGLLEHPAEKYPTVFGGATFFKTYPYFLPCLMSAAFAVLCWFIAYFLLEEVSSPIVFLIGVGPIITPIDYHTANVCKRLHPWSQAQASGTERGITNSNGERRQLPLRKLLVPNVLVAAGCYACLAFSDIASRTVLPVYFTVPIEMGGLGLGPSAIGTILSLQGLTSGVCQTLFFACLHDRLGPKNLYFLGSSLYFPAIILFPLTAWAARMRGLDYIVWALVGSQMILFVIAGFAFSVTFVYISAAAPNRASIGATNGLAQMMASVMRALGPASANSAFSLSIQRHVMGGYFVYWMMMVMASVSVGMGFLLPKKPWRV